MTLPAKLIFSLIGPPTLARFGARCEHPMREQEKLLGALLRENAETAYGRRCGFRSIDSLGAFQQRVPITEYNEIEPFIEAARRGRPAQLTSERPVFYAKTSGTTGAAKYIPVTESSRRSKTAVMRIWLSGLFRDHRAIFRGKVLQIAGPEAEELAPDGTPCGSEGGHAYRNMPRVLRGLYPLPYSVSEIGDYQARYYTMLRIAVMHRIAVIGTPNPSTILQLARELDYHGERLVRDVWNGTLDRRLNVPPEIRDEVEARMRPDRARATFLEHAASAGHGRLLPRYVWPDMELLACWKGGTVGPYLDELEQYFSSRLPIRDLGWLSSECRGSIPLSDETDSGPLAVSANLYEFFPAELDDRPGPMDLLTLDQIEAGRRYHVFVTTPGGLCRYAMHDIMEVTGFYRRTPSMRFVQKDEGIVSFTGEKLTETQVLAAVRETLEAGNGASSFIAAVARPPRDGSEPSYVFLVEYETPPDDEIATRTARDLDRALARSNVEYASKRRSGRLAPAVLRVLEPGQFHAFQAQALQAAAPDGQFKILRLTDDETFADHFARVVRDYGAR